MAIAHGLNTNVVRKWLAGRGPTRIGDAAPAVSGAVPALQFVPVKLPRSGPWSPLRHPSRTFASNFSAAARCTWSSSALYAARLCSLADTPRP
jgi:transposase